MITSRIVPQGTLVSRASLVAALGLSAALSGCTQETKCDELSGCGGVTPAGDWRLGAGHPSCSEDLYVPATDTRLLGGEITPARQPTIEPALFDWCTLLLTGAGDGKDIQLKAPRFYIESAEVGAANVTYTPTDPANPDVGRFTASITRTGRFVLDFPEVCVRAFGATDRPDLSIDPSGAPVPVCERLQVPLAASGLGEGAYPNADCYANPDDPLGCLCEFDATETGGPSGTYHREGNIIRHSTSGNFESRAVFCHEGDSLQITGADGAYLFNIAGLRTLDLGSVATTPIPFPPPNP
jgi:hypothetical protein